jgi:hypothetical protein
MERNRHVLAKMCIIPPCDTFPRGTALYPAWQACPVMLAWEAQGNLCHDD